MEDGSQTPIALIFTVESRDTRQEQQLFLLTSKGSGNHCRREEEEVDVVIGDECQLCRLRLGRRTARSRIARCAFLILSAQPGDLLTILCTRVIRVYLLSTISYMQREVVGH